MANKGDQAPEFQRGQLLTADQLNQVSRMLIKQLVGGKGIDVSTFGNRLVIENTAVSTPRGMQAYHFQVDVVQEDYLECRHVSGGGIEVNATTYFVAKPPILRGDPDTYDVGDIVLAARAVEDTGLFVGETLIHWEAIHEPAGAGASAGDTIPIITSEAGTVGTSGSFRRDDTKPGLKLFATKPGLEFKAADAGLSVKWATSPSEISPVSDAISGVGSLDLIAHSDHTHKLFAGNGLGWATVGPDRALVMSPGTKGDIWYYDTSWLKRGIGSAGQFLKVVAGLPVWSSETIPDPSSATPSVVVGTTGSPGTGTDYSRDDHVHGFDGTSFAGTGINWGSGQFSVDITAFFGSGGIRKVDGITNADGTAVTLVREDHEHGFDGTAFAGTGISWDGSKFNAADVPGSGTDGDMLMWSSGAWANLGIGSSDQMLVVSTGFPTWEDITSVVNHNILDADFHADAIFAGVSAGSLIIGNATPKWSELVIGSNGQVLTISSGAPIWATPSAVAHNWISATHSDTTTVAAAHGVIFGTAIAQNITLADGQNIIGQTTTGHQIGTAAGQKWAFHGAAPVVQASHIADPSGGTPIDSEARTAINAILVALENKGILAAA